jgi:hypothetical protein
MTARLSVPAALCLSLVVAGLLSGCGDARKALGFEKSVPDEFRVVSRAPLSLPPDYALRPPQPGAVRPQEQTIPQRAMAVVTGNPAVERGSSDTSVGENALLAKVGADRANPNIRDIVERESTVLANADVTLLDRVMFWRKQDDLSPVVDPERETQRIRENAALGRPLNEGDTPTIRRRRKAPLEALFN